MTEFIIDSSLSAAWAFPGESTEYTNGILKALSGPAEAIAPRLWAYEIRDSVLMGVRRKRVSLERAVEFLELLRSLPIRFSDPQSYDVVFDLAQANGLTVYDAAYIHLAMRGKLPLASLDQALCKAALQNGVMLFTALANS